MNQWFIESVKLYKSFLEYFRIQSFHTKTQKIQPELILLFHQLNFPIFQLFQKENRA